MHRRQPQGGSTGLRRSATTGHLVAAIYPDARNAKYNEIFTQ
jgi:hypothetical protein